MYAYSFLFFVISILLSFSSIDKRSPFFFFACLILVLFSGFRSGVGVDYQSYVDAFDQIRYSDLDVFEPFNQYLVKLSDLMGFGNQFIFFSYALIAVSCVGYFIYKLSPARSVSLFIFFSVPIFYLSSFNGIRQWVAMSMMLVAIVYITEKKFIRMSVAIFIAVMFHVSAIILVFLPLLMVRVRFLFLLLICLIFLLGSSFIVYLISISPYAIYLFGLRFEGGPNSMPLFVLYCIFLLVSPYLLGYFDKKVAIQPVVIILCNMNFVSLLILIVGSFNSIDHLIYMRLNAYFTLQFIILMPILVFGVNSKMRANLLIGLLLFCSLYYFNTLSLRGEDNMIVPYRINV